MAADPVVLLVVFALLDVVFAHDFDFTDVVFFLPVEEIYFFEELLFMMLEFSHHWDRGWWIV